MLTKHTPQLTCMAIYIAYQPVKSTPFIYQQNWELYLIQSSAIILNVFQHDMILYAALK